MSEYTRGLTIERADGGGLRAVVFTDGEASDGHILHIPGGKLPERMPLFVNHQADPRTQLGSLHLAERNDHEATYELDILEDGDGAEADVRRDIAAKMRAGHVTRMSGRWDASPEAAKPRTALPKNHYAFVPGQTKGSKRNGLFFEAWEGVEGSVVGIGADPAATLRWAIEAEDAHVSQFWRSQLPEEQRSIVDQLAPVLARLHHLEERLAALDAPQREEEEPKPDLPAKATPREAPLPSIDPATDQELFDAELAERLESARHDFMAHVKRKLDERTGRVS